MLLANGCVLCGRGVGAICERCVAQLRPCGSVRGSDPTIRALFRYDGTGREIVTTLKYRGGRRLVGPLGRALASLVTEVDAEVVTWVPASRSGRRERGFDQGRLLARSVARASGRRARCLLRRGPGPPQTGQPASGRHRGPRLDPRRSGRGEVILVDDVLTTGTTMASAAAALCAGGWRPVLGLVVASTPRLTTDVRRPMSAD